MRRFLVPACFLVVPSLVGPLGCGSAERDPKAAANAARGAGGALEPLSLEPKEGEGVDRELEKLPGGPIIIDRKPIEGGATCITDDDDPPTSTDDPPPQRKPPKKPNGPIEPIDPKDPEVQGAVPKAASSARTMEGGAEPSAPENLERERTIADGTEPIAAATTTKTATRLDYASLCETKMSDQCSSLCKEHELVWDRTAGTNGTCFELGTTTTSAGTLTTYDCGCMCT